MFVIHPTYKPDYKQFQKTYNKCYPDNPITEEESVEAFYNLGCFIDLLIQINKRVKLVPWDEPDSKKEISDSKDKKEPDAK